MNYSFLVNGYTRSFARGCEVVEQEGCVEDYYFDTCWTKCDTDLCNDGNGYPELVGAKEVGLNHIRFGNITFYLFKS